MYSIYRIKNKIDGKSYIGFTRRIPPEKRFASHVKRVRRGSRCYLHNAMRKYGVENFSFEVLAYGDDHKIGLQVVEPLIIELFPHEYNMTRGGEGILGYSHSEETREKNRIAALGMSHSLEAKRKMSVWQKGISKGPQRKVICPHCGKFGGISLMTQWHFDNCKRKA